MLLCKAPRCAAQPTRTTLHTERASSARSLQQSSKAAKEQNAKLSSDTSLTVKLHFDKRNAKLNNAKAASSVN